MGVCGAFRIGEGTKGDENGEESSQSSRLDVLILPVRSLIHLSEKIIAWKSILLPFFC